MFRSRVSSKAMIWELERVPFFFGDRASFGRVRPRGNLLGLRVPRGLKPGEISNGLRGAEAPLFHGWGGGRVAYGESERPDTPGPPDSRGRLSPHELRFCGAQFATSRRSRVFLSIGKG